MAIAGGEAKFGLQTPQTIVAHQIYDLHLVILWICILIAVVVFGFMFYAIVRHRRSVGHRAKQFRENTLVQIMWTVIPVLIVVGLAFPATRTVIAMKDTSSADITIKITGYQWKWRYDYLGENVFFYSQLSTPRDQIENREQKNENYLLEVDNPLVVPVGKKVRILLTANDVIHSWWMPAFGVKQDAIPGFVRDSWFKVDTPGVYRGQCAELCGKDHGFMPVVVEAIPEDKYKLWLAEQQVKNAAAAAAASSGRVPRTHPRACYDRVDCGSCRHRPQRQQEEPRHGGLEGSAVRPGDSRRDYLRTQRLGQRAGRHGAAQGYRNGPQVTRHTNSRTPPETRS